MIRSVFTSDQSRRATRPRCLTNGSMRSDKPFRREIPRGAAPGGRGKVFVPRWDGPGDTSRGTKTLPRPPGETSTGPGSISFGQERADVGEPTRDGRGGGHGGADEVGPAAGALAAFEVPVAR